MNVKTRFAPSPTGYLHVGGARTALFSYLYARAHQGEFVLRIEDTDLERSTPESVQAILDGMQWLGLESDAEPVYQTHRFDRYNQVIDVLLSKGKAYRCNCSKERLEKLREQQMANKQKPRYDGHCRGSAVSKNEPHVIRFANPADGVIVVDDMVRGRVTIANAELDDLIIRRTDGAPTYNLTVVVDDHDMDITHVIRGDDHLNNTPRQINMLQAMGWSVPQYAHLPMILGDDGARLSKRHGAVSVMQYAEDGYLPEALLNYLVRLGWSHEDKELFSMEEMVQLFDISQVNRSASSFNSDKLRWINQQYIKTADLSRLADLTVPILQRHDVTVTDMQQWQQIIEAQRERAQTLVELVTISLFYFRDEAGYDAKAAKKSLTTAAIEPLQMLQQQLQECEWNRQAIHAAITNTVETLAVGFGKVAMPLRVAVTFGQPAPDLDLTIYLIGRELVLQRIAKAVAYIQ